MTYQSLNPLVGFLAIPEGSKGIQKSIQKESPNDGRELLINYCSLRTGLSGARLFEMGIDQS